MEGEECIQDIPWTRFDARQEMIDELNGLYTRLSNGANPRLSISPITPCARVLLFSMTWIYSLLIRLH